MDERNPFPARVPDRPAGARRIDRTGTHMTNAVPTVEAPQHVERALCTACPHAIEDHDRISLRFCSVTTASRLDRHCACPKG